VLLSFLTTAVVTTHLLMQERARAAEAERRAGEVASLGRLGAEMLSTGRPEEALAGIASLIRTSLEVAQCRIYGWDSERVRLLTASPPDGAEDRLAPDIDAVRRFAQITDTDERWRENGGSPRRFFTALRAHGRSLGVLSLTNAAPIALDAAQQRFLEALAYYAALAIERTGLVAEAERAEALREADRLKDGVLASVSHDLRTPLTTIKALAQEGALRGEANALAIEEQADRLGRLVADLLDLSRLKAGALPLNVELNAAEDLVGAAIRQMAGLLKDRTVDTRVDFTEPALMGRFDFVQSLRIVSNLLGNALRYSPPSSPIELSVHRDGAALVFGVADRGPGIPAAERERIFEPFYRAPGAPADVGGAGLGLAIARRLAELQGGTLEYAARPDGGSVFALRLPADGAPGVFVKS
jgi:two-component system sensor histidine kinase KdpD